MSTEAKAAKLEMHVKTLQEELRVCKEAKSMSESCAALSKSVEQMEEPFTASHAEPNEWHKSQGGGGCIIL